MMLEKNKMEIASVCANGLQKAAPTGKREVGNKASMVSPDWFGLPDISKNTVQLVLGVTNHFGKSRVVLIPPRPNLWWSATPAR